MQIANNFVLWGYKDPSIFCPLASVTYKSFMQGIFNLKWHLKESLNTVMSWPLSVRRDMWKLYLAQMDYEKRQLEKNNA